MSHAPQRPKRTLEVNDSAAGGPLARAPKALMVAVVVLADLIFSSGLLFSKPNLQIANSSAGALSCERGSCQRQTAKRQVTLMNVAVPQGKPRLLQFTSKHCPSCSRMAPLVDKLERDCTAHDGTILPMDVDTPAGEELATQYGVNELPTFILIDSDGEEVNRLVGAQPRQQLAVALADVNGVLCATL